ncbi:MAG: A24 family peptidase [Actinomycetota bacterium]
MAVVDVLLGSITVSICLLAVTIADAPIASTVGIVALVPAAAFDIHHQRLPDRMVAAAAASLVLAGVAERIIGTRLSSASITDVAVGVLALAGPLLAVNLISPAAMGFGDVKAGVVLGAALGLGTPATTPPSSLPIPTTALVGLMAACALGAAVGLLRRRRHLPFGPALVLGAAIALCITPEVFGR